MLTILFQSFISIDTLKHFVDVTRFVDEVGARTIFDFKHFFENLKNETIDY